MNDIANELVSDPSLNQLCERLGLAQVCAVTLSVSPPPFLISTDRGQCARGRVRACTCMRAVRARACARGRAQAWHFVGPRVLHRR
jgi:hypothetical protein